MLKYPLQAYISTCPLVGRQMDSSPGKQGHNTAKEVKSRRRVPQCLLAHNTQLGG